MKLELIDSETASSIISEKDDYISNFSDFDLQSRLGTWEEVSKKDLLEFLSHQTLDWTNSEKEKVERIFEELGNAYNQYEEFILESVTLIKTTGQEESDAAYTRKNCIFLPTSMIHWSYKELKELIAHELFHIISTNNPDFRNRWYAKLGFIACPELVVPEEYKKLYVTNPDTIGKNCYVEYKDNGAQIKAVPFLYSKKPYRGGYFFQYFRFSFLIVEMSNNKCLPVYEEKRLKFVDAPQKLYDLCKEIDPYDNQHRLHPEEILAYYWSFLPFSESELDHLKRTFLLKIRDILHQNKNHVSC